MTTCHMLSSQYPARSGGGIFLLKLDRKLSSHETVPSVDIIPASAMPKRRLQDMPLAGVDVALKSNELILV